MEKHMRITTIALLAFAVLAGSAANAQHQHHGAAPGPAASPSSKAYEAANARMHKDMSVKLTGDADVDFARGMIPHHKGAVDMAKIVLEYGKDPELKKLAQDVIASQQKEIAFMQEWLKKKGH
jgi:uncharacterized protein (DUF305 family)